MTPAVRKQKASSLGNQGRFYLGAFAPQIF